VRADHAQPAEGGDRAAADHEPRRHPPDAQATGILHAFERLDHRAANASLLDFLEERWKGVHPILHGDQLRQARLDDWIFQGLLAVQHLPE